MRRPARAQRHGQDDPAAVDLRAAPAGRHGRVDPVPRRATFGRWPPTRSRGPGISIVPQGRRVFASLTVEENLRIAQQQRGRSEWDLGSVFELFPRLRERSRQRAGTLSGGEQQMLAIGRSLMTNPDLLIMDEPSEGLVADGGRARCGERIRDVRERGQAVLIAEQNVDLALAVADRVAVIGDGGVLSWSGEPEALRSNEPLIAQLVGLPGGTALTVAPNVDLLIRGGTVVSVDPAIGTLNDADVLVRDGRIAEVGRGPARPAGRRGRRRPTDDRDARARRDPLPHVELARTQLRDRGLRVLPGQVGDIRPLRARGLLSQRAARPRRGAERRDHHGPQLVAQHADAGARRRGAVARIATSWSGPATRTATATASPSTSRWTSPTSTGSGASGSRAIGAVRGAGAPGGQPARTRPRQHGTRSTPRWPSAKRRSLPVAIHTVQGGIHRGRRDGARAQGLPGAGLPDRPLPGRDRRRTARRWPGPARPLSYAVHSELRLGDAGDPRAALLRIARGRRDVSVLDRRHVDRARRPVPGNERGVEHGHPVGGHDTASLAALTFRRVLEIAHDRRRPGARPRRRGGLADAGQGGGHPADPGRRPQRRAAGGGRVGDRPDGDARQRRHRARRRVGS